MERAIRYVRDNFFAAREYKSLDDLNAQAMLWCNTYAEDRPCPEDREKTVGAVFQEESQKLVTLPDNLYPCDEMESVAVNKTPYVRFDLNDYSVPYQYVKKILTVKATLEKVTIIDGVNVIASHQRSFDKGAQIECEAHVAALCVFRSKRTPIPV